MRLIIQKPIFKPMYSKYKPFIFLLFAILTVNESLRAQAPGSWIANTSFNNINSLAEADDGSVWAATTGGLMEFKDGEITSTLTTVDGMHRLDPGAVIFDPAGFRLFLGYADGMIDILNLENGSVRRLEDIFRAGNFSARAINQFRIRDNRLFVATDFGIVVYNLETLLVIDTFSKLGSFNRAININAITFVNNNIWAATQQGVATGALNSNLAIDSNWSNFDENNGFVSIPVRAIESLNGRIFASVSDRNFEFNGFEWTESTLFTGNPVLSYSINDESGLLTGVQDQSVTVVDSDFNRSFVSVPSRRLVAAISLGSASSLRIFAGSEIDGLVVFNSGDNNFEFFTPPGPSVNLLDGLQFDGNTFISGTSRFSDRNRVIDNTKGYFIRRDGEWNTFSINTNNILSQNGFDLVFTTAVTDSFYYFGSWGQGIARHNKETDEIRIFDNSNSTLEGWVLDDPGFPVISGLDKDFEGRVWAVSRFGSTPLYNQMPGEDDWNNFSPLNNIPNSDLYVGLFVDSRNWKWVTLQNNRRIGRGLAVIETGDPADPSEQRGIQLTSDFNNGNLPDEQVTAIIEDLNGEIWIGTERGIAKFIVPEFILDGGPNDIRAQWLINADTSAASPFLLRDIQVTAMAVNGANQKWIGTSNEGIFLLNEEGNTILNQFTTTNSPLLSNSIQSLAVNPETGELFISTDVGLIVFRDIATPAVVSMDKLKVFPNPFVYDRHDRIFIEGLSQETRVRILGANGELIQTIEANGGRIEWNGRDFRGNRVGSGVYIVLAIDEENRERGSGKVVIIR